MSIVDNVPASMISTSPLHSPNAMLIFFTFVNLIKLPLYIHLSMMNTGTQINSILLFPLSILGIYIGFKLLKIIEENLFYNIIYALIFISSSKMLYDFLI